MALIELPPPTASSATFVGEDVTYTWASHVVQHTVHGEDEPTAPNPGGIEYEPWATSLTRAPREAFADSLDSLDDDDDF